MTKIVLVIGATLMLCCGGEEKSTTTTFTPCNCLIREYDTNPNSGMPIYYAEYNEEDCDHPQPLFIEDAPGIPEQQCPDECLPAYVQAPKAKSDAKAGKDAAPQVRPPLQFARRFPDPKEKKPGTFMPAGDTVTTLGTVKFWIQGEIEPVYAKLFQIVHVRKNGKQTLLQVASEIEPVADDKVDFCYDVETSFRRVAPVRLKNTALGTIIVPQQYRVRIGQASFLALTTR